MKTATTYKEIYVWQLPVRFYHWINALCIVVLSISGYLIGNPIAIENSAEASFSYWFGTIRFIHFVAAFVFFFNFLFRIYWGFVVGFVFRASLGLKRNQPSHDRFFCIALFSAGLGSQPIHAPGDYPGSFSLLSLGQPDLAIILGAKYRSSILVHSCYPPQHNFQYGPDPTGLPDLESTL